MNKNELIDSMAAEAGMTKADAGKALDAFIASVTAALKKSDEIRLVGFGTFSVSKRAATTARNPRVRQFQGEGIRQLCWPQSAHRCRNQRCSKEWCKIQSRQKPAGRFELRNLSLK